jgi:very-short-patch-repair endonuclease
VIQRVIQELASRQHGVVTRRQLLAAGISGDTIDGRLRRLQLRVLHAGVYLAGPVGGPRVREMAAVLACNGVVSHSSAGVLREVISHRPREPVDIAVHAARRVQRPGIRVHRCTLRRGDVERIDGVPVTTLPRTLFDLAAVATPRELERALAIAERGDAKVCAQLQRLLERHPTQRGTRTLRELLRRGAPTLTRSEAEERMLELICSAGLPRPATNVVVQGYEVDCYWREARLVVEVDGYAWHGSHRAFLTDRERDAALAAAGIQVLRLSWSQLTAHRDRTLVQLAMAIARNADGSR